MKIRRAFKTELDLNDRQRTDCIRHSDAARFAFNWGLSRKIQAYQAGEKVPTAIDLHRELNMLKKTELSWLYEVSKCAPQEALRNLDQAYAHFFRRVKQKRAGMNGKVKVGFPHFKSRKRGPVSFKLTGAIHVFEKEIQLPRLGVLRIKESHYLPLQNVHIQSATMSKKAGRWFVSLQVEMDLPDPKRPARIVAGVDLGINRMAQVSDGTYFENPRALKGRLQKIKRLQRTLSRRQKGSANHSKTVLQLTRAHYRAANIRKDALHQATTTLTRTKSVIIMEDLNVSGMLKNHHLAQAIADVGLYEFRRQMIYKGAWYGCEMQLADRFFPSTKRCSSCGQVKSIMGLGERNYHCAYCGLIIDRDLNAAINLEALLDL